MINSKSHEVIVAGAGPAGTAAAIRLSQLGVDCLVLEKAGGPREKHCGGAVSPFGVKLYSRLGLPKSYFEKHGYATNTGWIQGFGLELPGRTADGSNGFLVERRQLDWDFQQVAVSRHSVRIQYGAQVSGVQVGRDCVNVLVRQGGRKEEYSCRFLIAADGAASVIRTRLSGHRIQPENLILTSSGVVESDGNYLPCIRFQEDYMPTYSWVFPLTGNRVNVGIGIYEDVFQRISDWAEVERLIERMSHPDFEGKLSRWVINTNALEKRMYGCRVLLSGDAGAFVDPFTGEGISFALRSGISAANTIALARQYGAPFASLYLLFMSPVILRLVISKTLQRLWTRFPDGAKRILRSCKKNGFSRRLLFRYFSNS